MKDAQIVCELVLEFPSSKAAKMIADSVSLDNPEFVNLEIEDNVIRSNITAPTLSSLINTLDDYLACITLAEKIASQ